MFRMRLGAILIQAQHLSRLGLSLFGKRFLLLEIASGHIGI